MNDNSKRIFITCVYQKIYTKYLNLYFKNCVIINKMVKNYEHGDKLNIRQ